jgi:Na+-driven multidrug efflux pump
MEGMLQGMGKTFQPFLYNIIGMWGVRIVGTFICTQFFALGLESAWACMICHNLLLCILYIIFWVRNRNKFV